MQKSFVDQLFEVLKGLGLAVVFCLLGAFVFSLVLKFTDVSNGVITPVNQLLKALGILFGCFFALRGDKGWLKGLLVGTLTVALTYAIFSSIAGNFSLSALALVELLFGALAGVLSGIIAVNVRR